MAWIQTHTKPDRKILKWQFIDESSNMIHYSTRQQSTSQPDFTATDKVDQTEDNILEHPICKWPRGSKEWLICNVLFFVDIHYQVKVNQSLFLIWVLQQNPSDPELQPKLLYMTFYLHSCLVYPSRKLFEGFAGESSKKKFKPFNFKMRFGVCLSKFGQNRARRSGSVKNKIIVQFVIYHCMVKHLQVSWHHQRFRWS